MEDRLTSHREIREMPGIVFFGSPEFAIPSLEALVRAGERISAVVTQPDRPAGRGRRPRPPAVKAWAEEHGLEVVQPEKVKNMEFLDTMRRLAPELAVVVAFGQILPKSLLEIPELGFINVHASLLPKYRGAAPIQWAVMNGERVTGVTIQEVVRELDAGNILSQERVEIGPNETAGELHDRLARLGARMLAPTIAAMRAACRRADRSASRKEAAGASARRSGNRADMARPMTTENSTAPRARASPSLQPSTLAVRTMASTLIAGPEYRKAVAGPMPAPCR